REAEGGPSKEAAGRAVRMARSAFASIDALLLRPVYRRRPHLGNPRQLPLPARAVGFANWPLSVCCFAGRGGFVFRQARLLNPAPFPLSQARQDRPGWGPRWQGRRPVVTIHAMDIYSHAPMVFLTGSKSNDPTTRRTV